MLIDAVVNLPTASAIPLGPTQGMHLTSAFTHTWNVLTLKPYFHGAEKYANDYTVTLMSRLLFRQGQLHTYCSRQTIPRIIQLIQCMKNCSLNFCVVLLASR